MSSSIMDKGNIHLTTSEEEVERRRKLSAPIMPANYRLTPTHGSALQSVDTSRSPELTYQTTNPLAGMNDLPRGSVRSSSAQRLLTNAEKGNGTAVEMTSVPAPNALQPMSNINNNYKRKSSHFFDSSNPHSIDRCDLSPIQIKLAATYIADGKHARNPDHLEDEHALKCLDIRHSYVYRFAYSLVILQIFALGFFEQSCRHNNCALVEISQTGVRVWELCLLALVTIDSFMKYKIFGSERMKSDWFEVGQVVLVIATVIDIIMIWSLEVDTDYHYRFTRPFRALFLLNYSTTMKSAFIQVLKTIPDVTDVLFLAIFFFLLWTTVCLVVFLQEGTEEEHEKYFPNYIEGAWNLLVCWTTANFPDVMVPAYNVSRWYALFFVIFLVVNLYIFMSLILAVVYTSYRTHLREEVLQVFLRKRRALMRAFDIMKVPNPNPTEDDSQKHVVLIDNFYHVLKVMRPWYTNEKIKFIYDILDDGEDNSLDFREFANITQVLNLRLSQTAEPQNFFHKCMPSFYTKNCVSLFIRRITMHKLFDPFVDFLIVANGVQLSIHASEAETIEGVDNPLDILFTVLFQMEILLKIYSMPFKTYWSSTFNKYDVITVELSVLGIILKALDLVNGRLLVTFLLLRVFRLLRLLGRIERARLIVGTLFRIAPILKTFAGIQLSVFVFYCFVGMSAFGGGLTPQSTFGSAFYNASYFRNTFNNYGEGLVVCFELMVVNNWQVIVDGFTTVYGRGARVFFGSFYFLAVVLMLNIVVAFIIEAFTAEYDMEHATTRPEHIVNIRLQKLSEEKLKRERSTTAANDLNIDRPEGFAVNAKWIAKRKQKLNDMMWYLFSDELKDRVESEGT